MVSVCNVLFYKRNLKCVRLYKYPQSLITEKSCLFIRSFIRPIHLMIFGPYKRTKFCPFIRERGDFLAFSYKRPPRYLFTFLHNMILQHHNDLDEKFLKLLFLNSVMHNVMLHCMYRCLFRRSVSSNVVSRVHVRPTVGIW